MDAQSLTHVLIIDDDSELLFMVSESLHELGGFQVTTAANGEDGLRQCLELRPHCLVIDVKIPKIDGYQLVRVLRGDASTATIPLVILTAMAQERDRFIGLASGVDQYLTKPVSPTALIAAIQKALSADDTTRLQQLRQLAEE